MKRKHAEVIHAFADGADVQRYYKMAELWQDDSHPDFADESVEYRIKPAPKPDIFREDVVFSPIDNKPDSVKYTWSSETGRLKDCKVVE